METSPKLPSTRGVARIFFGGDKTGGPGTEVPQRVQGQIPGGVPQKLIR